jgi:23S rRNA pseudoU1915 N3-methylase RlmH
MIVNVAQHLPLIKQEFQKYMTVEPTGILEIVDMAWMSNLARADEESNVTVEEWEAQKIKMGISAGVKAYDVQRKAWYSHEVGDQLTRLNYSSPNVRWLAQCG